jgi:hypothetical protein
MPLQRVSVLAAEVDFQIWRELEFFEAFSAFETVSLVLNIALLDSAQEGLASRPSSQV